MIFTAFTPIENENLLFCGNKSDCAKTNFQSGDKIDIVNEYITDHKSKPEQWDEMENIIGAGPILINDGSIIKNYKDFTTDNMNDDFFYKQHPRTGLCIDLTGKWKLVVVDGRGHTRQGMSIEHFANTMQRLNCLHAINLDGGGSSAMFFDGKIINKTSGNPALGEPAEERPLPNAIIIKKIQDS